MRYKGLHPNSINEVSQSVVGIYAGGEQIALFGTGSTVFNTSVTGSTFSGSFYGDGSNLSGVSTFPYTGTAVITGSLVVTNQVSASLFSGSFYGDGSNLTGLTQGNKIFTQTVPASTWTFVHAAGANYPVVTIYNDSDEVVVPTRILNVDSDTLQVEFGSPVAGYAVVSFGDRIAGSTVKQDFTTPSVSWSFEHNLGSQFVQVQVFDSNDQQIIPSTLTLLNISSSLITFASASTGYALATIGGEPITGLFQSTSASFESRITDLETFSSSLDATFATDAELAAVSSSIVNDVSSSYLLKTTDTFNGDLTVTGSLEVTGSATITGSLSVNNYTFPLTDGTVNQIMFTDGAGNITFDFLRDVFVEVKNVSLATLPKGTPVHVSGSTGNTNLVIPASASDATTMPATFVLNEQLAPDQEGLAIAIGFINGVNTAGFTEGDVVYVGENGGYTNIKPTGSNLIQNLGIVTKIDASNGSGYVLGAGRTNAVPNLLNGEVFFGEGNTAVQKSLATILSSSFYNYSGSFTGSLLGTASTASYVSFAGVDGLTSFSSSVSTRVTDLETASGSFSTRVTANESAISSLTAATSSYLLNTTDTLDGDLTVTGKITAQEFHTEFVSASIIYQSGSTKFGDTFDDIHSFTGSVSITGSGTFTNYGPAYFMQGNVGIGTTSPQRKLHISDGGTSGTQVQINGTSDSAGIKFIPASGDSWEVQANILNQWFVYNRTDEAYRLLIDGSGNVGIGTTSPDSKLHIESTGSSALRFTRSGASTYGFEIGGTIFGIYDYTNSVYRLRANGNDVLLAESNGNVGIGTTSPNSKFVVRDDTTANQVNQFSFYTKDGSESTYNATGISLNSESINSSGENGISFVGFSARNPALNGTHGTSAYITMTNGSGTSYGDGQFDFYIRNNTAPYTFTNDPSVSNAFWMPSLMTIKSNGNVGIGTTSPLYKVHAVSSNFQWQMEPTTAVSLALLKPAMTSGNNALSVGKALSTNNTSNLRYTHIGDGSASNYVGLGFWGNDDILNILASGNVGIGTTSPASYKLNVAGTSIKATNDLILGEEAYSVSSDYVGLKTTFQSGANDYMILSGKLDGNTYISAKDSSHVYIRGGGNDGGNQIILYDSGITDRIDFDTTTAYFNGNVGIGDTSPSYELDVNGVIRATTAIRGANGVWMLSGDSTQVTLGSAASSVDLRFDAGSVNRMFVNGDTGNVGIGTTNPAYKEHIVQTSGAAHWGISNQGDSNGDRQLRIGFGSGGTVGTIQGTRLNVADDVNIALQAGGGNVGIGTTTPTAKLQIEASGSTVFDIQGSVGQLFSVTDSLTGTLMSVNDISGIPILEVDSNDTVTMGTYGAPGLVVSGSSIVSCGDIAGNRLKIGTGHTLSGTCATIAGGQNNIASGNYSTIGGGGGATVGCCNIASGNCSTIGGGRANTASSYDTTIGGGANNTASSGGSTVGGGISNTASCRYSTVGGGISNTASERCSTVGGGFRNIASGIFSTVSGGCCNRACGGCSAVTGGCNNVASGIHSIVGAGFSNTADGIRSGILGGRVNHTCTYADAFIIGSQLCATTACYTFVNNLCNVGGGTSDCRLKENINTLPYGLCEINRLEPVSFNFKDDASKKIKYGFIAQCVQEVMPDLIYHHPTDKVDNTPVLQFDKEAIWASLVNAVKDLQKQNEELQKRIEILETKN